MLKKKKKVEVTKKIKITYKHIEKKRKRKSTIKYHSFHNIDIINL